MKEIVVISGKGGTGKTSITASFCQLGATDLVAADCDVDAADMHLLLQPDFENKQDFYSGERARIETEECIGCGICHEVCRFDAISAIDDKFEVDPLSCEGCGYCARVCPVEAIRNESVKVGQQFISQTRFGNILVHAHLGIGADNSGKLVAKVKNDAKRIANETHKEIILIDGSPGIGCPVVSSLSGADLAVIVTEPTVSGFHDLKRIYELVKKFKIQAACIINKCDINPKISLEIAVFLCHENIIHLSNLPYDENFTRAMTQGKTIVEYERGDLRALLSESWEKIKNIKTN